MRAPRSYPRGSNRITGALLIKRLVCASLDCMFLGRLCLLHGSGHSPLTGGLGRDFLTVQVDGHAAAPGAGPAGGGPGASEDRCPGVGPQRVRQRGAGGARHARMGDAAQRQAGRMLGVGPHPRAHAAAPRAHPALRSTKLAVAAADRVVHLYDEAGARRDRFRTKPADGNASGAYVIAGLAFSPDAARLAVAQSDSTVFVYRWRGGGEAAATCSGKRRRHPLHDAVCAAVPCVAGHPPATCLQAQTLCMRHSARPKGWAPAGTRRRPSATSLCSRRPRPAPRGRRPAPATCASASQTARSSSAR